MPLSGGQLLNAQSFIGAADETAGVYNIFDAGQLKLTNTDTGRVLSVTAGGIDFYGQSEDETDPSTLLSSVSFTLNDRTKSLADILSGYVSRQYVDDMIGDLEHLLETT